MPYPRAYLYMLGVIAVIIVGFWPSYFAVGAGTSLAIPRPWHRREPVGDDGHRAKLDGASQGAASASPGGRQGEPVPVPLPDRRAWPRSPIQAKNWVEENRFTCSTAPAS